MLEKTIFTSKEALFVYIEERANRVISENRLAGLDDSFCKREISVNNIVRNHKDDIQITEGPQGVYKVTFDKGLYLRFSARDFVFDFSF